ncbi:MAG: hypothetical protein NT040_06485 [Bacteroidetes bacterium]|nr:hypothetical protein [Bacteroidota bacterium]
MKPSLPERIIVLVKITRLFVCLIQKDKDMNKIQSLITSVLCIILVGYGCGKSSDVICIPTLIFPISDTLDNGVWHDSTGCKDYMEWTFKWKACSGASNYHLYVIHENALNPAFDYRNIGNTSVTIYEGGWVPEANLNGWKWKVRARVDGQWGEWSEWRTFSVEPPGSDCK